MAPLRMNELHEKRATKATLDSLLLRNLDPHGSTGSRDVQFAKLEREPNSASVKVGTGTNLLEGLSRPYR